MAHIITTEAKNLKQGNIFNFHKRKTKFIFLIDNGLTYKYKNPKNNKEFESSFYNDIVDIIY